MPSASDELDQIRRAFEDAGWPIDAMTVLTDTGAEGALVSVASHGNARRSRRTRTREVELRLPFDDARPEASS